MDRDTKAAKSEELRGSLEGINAVVLMGFAGLTVLEVDDLRNKFRDAGCTYQVHKNSTIKYAVQGSQHEALSSLLKGDSAIAYNVEDPGAPARVARDFAKDHEKLTIKGGAIDGQTLDEAGINTLASMPGPQELKAQLLMLFNTPATNMVRVLNASCTSLLNVLNAKKDKDAAA